MTLSDLVSGLLLGGFYALIALGLSLVFGVLKMVNLAHGELVIGGGYLAVALADSAGLSPLVSLPIVVVVVGLLAYGVQRVLLNPLLVRGANGPLVATFGLGLLAQAVFIKGFSSNPRSVPGSLATAGFDVGGVRVRTAYAVGFAVAAVVCSLVHLVMTRTRAGSTVRAAAADPATAELMGINVRNVYAVTFAVATAISAIGGVLVAATFSISPTSGAEYLLIGFAVVVLGGVGNIAGTFVGALLIGAAQTAGGAYLGGGYRTLTIYLLLLVVLVARPQGLFTRSLA